MKDDNNPSALEGVNAGFAWALASVGVVLATTLVVCLVEAFAPTVCGG